MVIHNTMKTPPKTCFFTILRLRSNLRLVAHMLGLGQMGAIFEKCLKIKSVEEAEGFARMAREDSQRLEELKSMVKESRDDSCFLSFVKKRKHYISQNEIQLSVPFRGGNMK